MDRRAFITMVGGSMLAAPVGAEAQPVGKVYRLGYLAAGSSTLNSPYATKFELVVNVKTAKALVLPIRQSILVRADEIIQ